MARKQQVRLVDDLDGSPATQTIRFGLGGRDYNIDLSEDNAQRLRDAMEPYAAVARVVGSSWRTRRVLRIAVTPETCEIG